MIALLTFNGQITTRKVAEELASNETLLYIQKLEAETERLKKQVRDVAQQLHTCKVCFVAIVLLCLSY